MRDFTQRHSRSVMLAAFVTVLAGFYVPAHAGLLVRYTFDEASSGTTNALNVGGSLGSSADGVFNTASAGTATRTIDTPKGPSGAALSLNAPVNNQASNDFVGPSTDLNGLDGLTKLTVSMWINVQSSRHAGSFYVMASDIPGAGVNTGWMFYYNPQSSDTLMQLGLEVDATAVTAKNADTTAANVDGNNKWLFVAATWDSSNSELKFYSGTDTSPVTQVGVTQTLTSGMTDNAVAMRLSGYANNPDTAPNALIDDFRVYDGPVLSLAELDTVRTQNTPEPASLGVLALGGLLLGFRRR